MKQQLLIKHIKYRQIWRRVFKAEQERARESVRQWEGFCGTQRLVTFSERKWLGKSVYAPNRRSDKQSIRNTDVAVNIMIQTRWLWISHPPYLPSAPEERRFCDLWLSLTVNSTDRSQRHIRLCSDPRLELISLSGMLGLMQSFRSVFRVKLRE